MSSFVSVGKFIFCHCLWNTWRHIFFVFSMATTKCTVPATPWHIFNLHFCLAWSKALAFWQNRAVCFAPWNDTLLAALKSRFEFELWNLRIWICNVNCHKTGALSAAKGRNIRFAERERSLSVRAWAWRRALPKLPSSLAPKTVSLKDAIQQRAAIASQLERRHSGDVTTQWPPRRKPFAFNVRA